MSEGKTAPAASSSGLLRVLVIDDHPLFCDALSMTLESAFAAVEVRTANRLCDGISTLGAASPPDVVLLDLNLPDADGLDGLVRIRSASPNVRVIVVSSFSDNRTIASAMGAGASGFIPKDSARPVLLDALSRVRAGETFVPADFVAPEARDHAEAAIEERLQTLTPAQSRILELVSAGMLNKQIAYELSVAETTVKAHITAILRKLGVQNRTQAVLAVQRSRPGSSLKPTSEAD